jgi:hypothetical protein
MKTARCERLSSGLDDQTGINVGDAWTSQRTGDFAVTALAPIAVESMTIIIMFTMMFIMIELVIVLVVLGMDGGGNGQSGSR